MTTADLILIATITIACAAGIATGLAKRCNILEDQLDRIEQKIDQTKPTE